MIILFLTNYQFEDPWFLILLILVPVLLVKYLKTAQKQGSELGLPGIESDQVRRNWKIWLKILQPYFTCIALALMIIALARPQEIEKEEEIKAEGIDIFLTMDLSISMLAKDFEPNRLEASKQVALEFIEKRSFDRIGLSIFSGDAFTQCPLTSDHRVLKEFVQDLNVFMFESTGTAIGMGLSSALNRLKDSQAKSKVVILLTDGKNNAGYINPELAASLAKELGIRVYTIGVGTEGEALGPINIDRNNNIRMGMTRVEIDEKLLRDIAATTGGRYFRATNLESLQAVYDNINKMEKTVMEVTVIKHKSDHFRPFLLIGLGIILLFLILDLSLLRSIN
jgi:Ca-activated chloride channel family protein